MAAPDSKTRFAEAVNLLNYGFNTCDIYKDDGMPLLENIRISKGKKTMSIAGMKKNFHICLLIRLIMKIFQKSSI